ncbi:hypothetical protein P7K49_005980, partial [Saguinus oedipus]
CWASQGHKESLAPAPGPPEFLSSQNQPFQGHQEMAELDIMGPTLHSAQSLSSPTEQCPAVPSSYGDHNQVQ